ncbi:DUF418 domain-containing protein [Cellulomonas sp. APG4]|uniref:DUF418 domain-containing protein n=1 Tax=Cellulomonas sp. APG4 TaxID=1538656 RepID=UPI0013795B96|nr:DUF418 domain-containing protein [Cellulomonas sp. APG4]NCT89437.1 DUF418 domain-containing protein [Cellulomonas sp. APG4]
MSTPSSPSTPVDRDGVPASQAPTPPASPPAAPPVGTGPPQAAHGASPVPPATPLELSRRAVAPDVARGLALLGIAIANSVIHLWGGPVGAGLRPVDGSTLDRVVDGVVSLLVDRRTMPMFALLYGYGIGVVLRRRAQAGVPWLAARGDLVRRAAVLAAFGAVHIVLLFEGDILATYGLTGLLAVTLVRARGRTLAVVGGIAAALGAIGAGSAQALAAWEGAAGDLALLGDAEQHVLGAMVVRLMSLFAAPFGVALALPLVLLGLWFARSSVLEEPQRHLALLRRWVLGGLSVSVVGGLPMALAVARVWDPGPAGVFGVATLHELTGMAGGVAFASLVAWVVAARGATVAGLGPVGRALRAVGVRSLTCYLLQSVLFVLPLRGWAGGLGEHLSSAQVVAWAVGVWLVTVVVAVLLERAGRRGPAEALYRRLVYRTPQTA